jgi:DNA-binding CsgD family transcriptional regulator/tetratricopeptide (TPR) repeat protein
MVSGDVGETIPASGKATELLERAAALSSLGQELEAVVRSRRGHVVLVGGEAGVGKTALLRRFRDELGDGIRVLWGACAPLFTPRPLGPLLDVAERLGGALAEAAAGDTPPPEVAAAVADELRARTPTVFVLEDVHWADEATLDVLRLLARRVDTMPALVLASFRDDELDRDHPLRRVLGELATSGAASRLKVGRLSPAAVAELAEPYDVDVDELYETTGGNPFFVVEALAAGDDEIPDTVRDAVLSRAARLGSPATRLLEAVAICPSGAELWLLEALAGDAIDRLDDCLASGMLDADATDISFRHELARLAVEEAIGPRRKVALHRKALAALTAPAVGAPDPARLAHHAEAAGDGAAVLRFAREAGHRAEARGAHREAAAQYARALRFGTGLTTAERAELLERRSRAAYLTDQSGEAIAALEDAVALRQELRDTLAEGDDLRRLGEILWCPGRTREARRRASEAVDLLETLPPGRELALAYGVLASRYAAADRFEEALAWGTCALDLAERLGDGQIRVHSLATIGACELDGGGFAKLEQSLALAQATGLAEEAARVFVILAGAAVERRLHDAAERYLSEGLAWCGDRGFELFRMYLLAYRGRSWLDQGRWTEAADAAAAVLRLRRTSATPGIVALTTLGLVRTRRGDPGRHELLDDAWRLAEPTGELARLAPVAAARAEAAWLDGDLDGVADATESALALAVQRRSARRVAELAAWRRRAGLETPLPAWAAAEPWAACPYEEALALADEDAEAPLRRALDELQRAGAQPATTIVTRRLRELGARGVPRGPRRRTRENPFGLTSRQLEVLALLADGRRNAEIADRLVLSERTVDHHVGAILRKLEARTRGEAGATAIRLGLVGQDG